jgi:hypothetical protein
VFGLIHAAAGEATGTDPSSAPTSEVVQ